MIRPLKLLLWSASQLYGLAVAVRNRFYDLGIFRSQAFNLPVICVGNITAGGTGKTPHVIYLAEKLTPHTRVAVLSRGYLRKSRGFLHVTHDSTTSEAGDEPLLMAQCLPQAAVYVDRDRVNGIREIMRAKPRAGAVILDDGFQHRAVKAGMNILLSDWQRLMTRDHLLPLGMLREHKGAVKRADIIIVTKVPLQITPVETAGVTDELRAAGFAGTIYFTTLTYSRLKHVFNGTEREITPATSLLLITGIAAPQPLVDYLGSIAGTMTRLAFPDHYKYTLDDLERITMAFNALDGKDKLIVTTAKDAVRLKEITNIAVHVREALFYLPVSVQFIENEDDFLSKVYSYAGKYHKDC
ncbi:MAG: tetraacyldisaccharide 4'-kinase [Bacteroidales bacterium]|nr:tetraacyldisaccharide 4'-kinase [Bacteroidales bacterium]